MSEEKKKIHKSRLHRSRKEKILAGICGGLSQFFNVDPIVFRVIVVIIFVGSLGALILLYILLWIVIPLEPKEGQST